MKQYKIVTVQFRNVGKHYFFDPNGLELEPMDRVVLETVRGLEMGTIVKGIQEMSEENLVLPIKPIIRKANKEDLENNAKNIVKMKSTLARCKELANINDLNMKFVDGEYTLDRKRVIFYYTASGRVDFRDLLKDLANEFKTRIELRQIGERDATKFLGGIGICGRVLCCCSHLNEFDNISINMAKQQHVSLNASKISGNCGKLLCCLKYENETYKEANKRCPKIAQMVETEEGQGKVIAVNVLTEDVRVLLKDKMCDCKVSDLKGFSKNSEEIDVSTSKPTTEEE